MIGNRIRAYKSYVDFALEFNKGVKDNRLQGWSVPMNEKLSIAKNNFKLAGDEDGKEMFENIFNSIDEIRAKQRNGELISSMELFNLTASMSRMLEHSKNSIAREVQKIKETT